jgi:hypothetical protein
VKRRKARREPLADIKPGAFNMRITLDVDLSRVDFEVTREEVLMTLPVDRSDLVRIKEACGRELRRHGVTA